MDEEQKEQAGEEAGQEAGAQAPGGPVVTIDSSFVKDIEKETGVNVGSCFQCMKCSSGCPLAFTMELVPHQVMKAVQLGLKDKLLEANTSWICATCYTCSVRCPNDIDIPRVMDHLRQMTEGRALRKSEKDIKTFHKCFLKSIRRHGKASEFGAIVGYKMRSGHFFQDMGLGMKMMGKGKLHFLPRNIQNKQEIKEIFRKAEEKE